ncbi:MAG: Swt1 family HEPN domain-containing protein [Acidimicrobiales bacterium]
MSWFDDLKLFHMNRSLVNAELRSLAASLDLELIPASGEKSDRDRTFYPQFPEVLRASATSMAEHYEIFYCLENFIREMVAERLEEVFGIDWWEADEPKVVVPMSVKENVKRNVDREHDAAVTARSSAPIDYTTFGELSTIIDSNWETFGDLFNSRKGTIGVLARLNLLRGPIAHCSELSEDEVLRLRLTLADWFRLMG